MPNYKRIPKLESAKPGAYRLIRGMGTLSSPSPLPSPLGRGRMVLRPSVTPVPELAQRPSAIHQSDACCSLSLRERVRVRGKYSLAYAKCSISEGLLSVASFLSFVIRISFVLRN